MRRPRSQAPTRVKGDYTLSSRARQCPFQGVKLDVLLRAIPRYHPIYEAIGPDNIQRIYERYAGGDLRRWAEFAITAIDECQRRRIPALDTTAIGAVLAELAPQEP